MIAESRCECCMMPSAQQCAGPEVPKQNIGLQLIKDGVRESEMIALTQEQVKVRSAEGSTFSLIIA